jgi:hypothetical protein
MATIKRDALHAFVDRQLFLIESTPPPADMLALAERDRLEADEAAALWIGAGIASQIGMALALEPDRFVEPWPGREPEPEVPATEAA